MLVDVLGSRQPAGHGPNDAGTRISDAFEAEGVSVVRVAHAAAACERLAISMPQVVVVLGALRDDERDALADRAMAVGALVLHVDPAVDAETLDALVERAAQVARERSLARDGSGRPGALESVPPASVEEIDSGWGESR